MLISSIDFNQEVDQLQDLNECWGIERVVHFLEGDVEKVFHDVTSELFTDQQDSDEEMEEVIPQSQQY